MRDSGESEISKYSYEDNNEQICFICRAHGSLVICDNCHRSFHHGCVRGVQIGDEDAAWLCQICAQHDLCYTCNQPVAADAPLRLACAVCYRLGHAGCQPPMPQTELAAALYGPLGFSLGICEGCRGINEPLQQVGKFQARGRVYLVLLHEAFSPLHAFVLPEAEVGLEKLPLGEMKANLELELILDQKGDWECRQLFDVRGVKVKCKWRGVSIEQATWEELSVVQRLSAKYEQFRFTRRLDQLIKQELPPLALVEALRKERLLPSVQLYVYQEKIMAEMKAKYKQFKAFFLSLAQGTGNASMCVLFLASLFRDNPSCQSPFLVVSDREEVEGWCHLFDHLAPQLRVLVFEAQDEPFDLIQQNELYFSRKVKAKRFKVQVIIATVPQVINRKSFFKSTPFAVAILEFPLRLNEKFMTYLFRGTYRLFVLRHNETEIANEHDEVKLINLIDAVASAKAQRLIEFKSKISSSEQQELQDYVSRFKKMHILLYFKSDTVNEINRSVRVVFTPVASELCYQQDATLLLTLDQHLQHNERNKLPEFFQLLAAAPEQPFAVVCEFSDTIRGLQAGLLQRGVSFSRLGDSDRPGQVLAVPLALLHGARLPPGHRLVFLTLAFSLRRVLQALRLPKCARCELQVLVGLNCVDRLLLEGLVRLRKDHSPPPHMAFVQGLASCPQHGVLEALQKALPSQEALVCSVYLSMKLARPREEVLAACEREGQQEEPRAVQIINAESITAEISPQIKRAVLQFLLLFGMPASKDALQAYLASKNLEEQVGVCYFVLFMENYENIGEAKKLDWLFGVSPAKIFSRIEGLTLLQQLCNLYRQRKEEFSIDTPKYQVFSKGAKKFRWTRRDDFFVCQATLTAGFGNWKGLQAKYFSLSGRIQPEFEEVVKQSTSKWLSIRARTLLNLGLLAARGL